MANQTKAELQDRVTRQEQALLRYEALHDAILTWRFIEGRGVNPLKENLFNMITHARAEVSELLEDEAETQTAEFAA
jgi:hypothetical protein